MKYIRTKDNRLFKTKDYFMLPLDYLKFSVYGSNETFYEGHVLVADTIEELCDLFVLWHNEKTYNVCNNKIRLKELALDQKEYDLLKEVLL